MENEVQKKGKKKLLIPLLLLLLLLVGGGIFAATQLLGGAKYGPEVDVSDFQTLKEAIETTKEGQTRTLTLLNDIYMEDTITLPEGVVINIKDDGTSRSLVRDLSDSWMFWVPEESTLNIAGSKAEGVVLDGASGTIKAGPDGALIISEYGTITLDNVLMKDNRSNQGLGGMMRLVGCDLTATNSTFTNGAGKSGGVVYAVESNLSFTDCDLSKNSSTVGHGGAVYADNASELVLERCTLNNNEILTGAGYGGAVIITNFSHAAINDCTFDGNKLDHDGTANGGAMYIAWGSVADVTNTSFTNNTILGSENHLGGAIYINEGSTLNAGEGVTFIGNRASHGGAIYAIDTVTLNLDGVYFEDNATSIGNGGAVYCWRDPVMNAKNCTFVKNYTKSEGNAYGGAVAFATGAPVGVLENCVFEGNYTENAGYCNGGALLVGEGSTVTLKGNNVFTENWGKSTGGKNTCGGAVYVSKASLTIEEGTTFTANYGSHGGAIYVNYGGLLDMTGAKFDKNYTYLGHGGAVCAWNGGEVKASSCSFTNNYIKSEKSGYGGAVAIYNKDKEEYNSVGTFNNCSFVGNNTVRSTGEANANGGAIYAGMGGDVYINGGVFRNNYARTADLANTALSWRGGAIYSNTNSTLKVNGATFSGNSGQHGGAIFAQESAVLSVTNSTFTGNNTTEKGSHGGAIYVNRMPATISGCKFTDNWAQGIAGAVMLNGKENTMGSVAIKNCTFTGNHTPARTGGAVAAYDAIKLEITGSTFNGNYTNASHGGAVYTQNMPAVIKNSTFTGNYIESTNTAYGGAVAIVNDSSHFEESTGTVTDCVFDGNYVQRTSGANNANGGALYFGLYTKAVVDGETSFSNNYVKVAADTAVAYGGGLYLNTGCSLIVGDQVTFTGNSAKRGGAIGIGGGNAAKTVVNLNGPTLVGNTATEYSAGIYFDSYADLSVNGITITPAEGDQVADILIKKGLTLDLQGKVNIGTVAYEDTTSLIHLDAALAEGSAITIIPAEYTEGLQVVTAAEVEVAEGAEPVNLLKDIKNIITVAAPADNTVWIVGDDGKLEDRTPSVRIGEKEYATLAEALAEAKEGDLIELFLDDTVKADATVPAGATIWSNGKTISVADGVTFTLSDGVIIDGAKIDGDVTVGNVDLTKNPITGKVTVAEGKTLTVGGDFTAEEVALAAGAKVNVATALTNAPAFLLTSAVETVDTVLVTAPDAEATKAAVAAVDPFLKDSAVALGENGIIIADATVATITKDGVTTKYEAINDAIAAAENGDTIVIVKSFIQKDRIDVTGGKVVTIDGNGKTIVRDASRKAAMVYVYGATGATGTLTLTNITLDGNKDECAATEPLVLIKAGSTVNIGADTVITNAYRAGNGGAVHSSGVLTVDGATFTNNGTAGSGAAIFVNSGSATITNATITGNTAANGAAVYLNAGSLTMTNGTVSENTVSKHGGAVYALKGSLTIDGTIFDKNEAGGNGGAIEIVNPVTVDIKNATFTNNKALNTFDDPAKDDDTGTYGRGGAMSIDTREAVTLTNVTAKNNSARQGGAFYTYSKVLNITGGTYEANSATDAGGVFMTGQQAAQITIDGGTYTGNVGAGRGGVAYIRPTDVLTIKDGTFTNNSTTVKGADLTKSPYGGGVIWADSDVTVLNGTFTGNKANNGGVFCIDTGTETDTNDLTIHNGKFSANGSTGTTNNANGGGVIFLCSYDKLTINGGIFGGDTAAEGNTSATDGGVFYKLSNASTNGETVITITKTEGVDLKFINNKSTKDTRMGGVFASASGSLVTLNVTGAEFSKNSALGNGGVMYLHSGVTSTFTNCTFTGNYVERATGNAHGGALFVNGVNTTITGCSFAGNYAKATGVVTGGAIRQQNVPLTIDATTTFSTENPNKVVVGTAETVNDIAVLAAGIDKLTNNATGAVVATA